MNLVDQFFPKKSSKDSIVEGMCFVMHFYNISRDELDELAIGEFRIMHDFALRYTKQVMKAAGQGIK